VATVYRGSIGPLNLDAQEMATFEAIGQALGKAFGLVGLFGVDAVIDRGDVWPIEVNPRFTASVEVLERSLRFSAVAEHLEACQRGTVNDASRSGSGAYVGKAILYADRPLVVSERFVRTACERCFDVPEPETADIPVSGTKLRVGQPVMTVFASGPTLEGTRLALTERLADWKLWLVGAEATEVPGSRSP
jgi:predicted ATP-grasp superfamily ATP-dependent carboligase